MNDDYANPVVVAIVVVVVVVSVAAAVMVVFAVEHAVAQCSLSRRFLKIVIVMRCCLCCS